MYVFGSASHRLTRGSQWSMSLSVFCRGLQSLVLEGVLEGFESGGSGAEHLLPWLLEREMECGGFRWWCF
jgi:hypothetical protein